MTKRKIQSGFTLVELLVAMGLLAAIFVASGFIFSAAVKAQRTAKSVLEITQKLQTITSQLDADFKGLRKDGPIFAVWVTSPKVDYDGDGIYDKYDRFDRIMFFASDNYQTYNRYDHDNDPETAPEVLRGNTARITYMLAHDYRRYDPLEKDYSSAENQEPKDRILARSQHLLITNPFLDDFPFPVTGNIPTLNGIGTTDNDNYLLWNNETYEYDNAVLGEWKNVAFSELHEMLTIATGIKIGSGDPTEGGLVVTADNPGSLHMLLCEGVGDFSIQGWSDADQRWYPQTDPDGDGILVDGDDFYLDGTGNIDSTTYPGWLYMGTPSEEANFNNIPGLGRAFKFTFTIYDSRGLFPEGRTFSHIVYVD